MRSKLIVVGTGGCAKDILATLEGRASVAHSTDGDVPELIFAESSPSTDSFFGHPIIPLDSVSSISTINARFIVAIANPRIRERLHLLLASHGFLPVALISDRVRISGRATIGEGCVISEFVNIPSNAVIGRSFHCNYFSYVAHDSRIGDFVTFGPRVGCNGNVVIEDFVTIGAGAVIRPGTREDPLVIGRGSTVGMGAVVTRSVPPNATVVGNPAKHMAPPAN